MGVVIASIFQCACILLVWITVYTRIEHIPTAHSHFALLTSHKQSSLCTSSVQRCIFVAIHIRRPLTAESLPLIRVNCPLAILDDPPLVTLLKNFVSLLYELLILAYFLSTPQDVCYLSFPYSVAILLTPSPPPAMQCGHSLSLEVLALCCR